MKVKPGTLWHGLRQRLMALAGKSDAAAEDEVQLHPAVLPLLEADGTQSRKMFYCMTLPVIWAVGVEARKRDAATAEACVLQLIEDMTAACKRARNTRLPQGRPGTDYRKYEVHYNYALITAMAVAWHMEQCGETGGHLYFADKLIPFDGMRRLKDKAMVWSDWQAFFTGADDGGLRALAGRSLPPGQASGDKPVLEDSSVSKTYRTREQIQRDSKFVIPHRCDYAGEDAVGWDIVQFIRESLQAGQLSYNKRRSWVQVDREGRTFLQVPEIFAWCRENMQLEEPVKRLQNRFGRLNISVRYRKRGSMLYGARPSDKRFRAGYVVADADIFWDGYPPGDRFVIRDLTPQSLAKDQQRLFSG